VATVLVVYGALLRFDALLVHSRLAIENPTAATVHRWLRPTLPNYGLLNIGNAPEDPYRADVRSYLDRASTMSLGGFYRPSFREPFYVALVKLFVTLFGGREIGILIQSFFFSVLALPVIYLIGSRLAGRWWATAALAPLALHEWLVLEAPTGYRMSAYSLFLLAFTGWVFCREKQHRWAGPVAAGVLAAAVCLTRLSGLSFVLPLLLLKAWSTRNRGVVSYVLICFLVLSLLVAPFMLSSFLEHGDPFYSLSFHTRFWLDAEETPSGPAGSVSVFQYLTEFHLAGELASGVLRGFTLLPMQTFWNGLARFPLLNIVVMAGGIAGLLLVLPTPYRFLTLAYFGHLIPFTYIQNFPSGTMPRFVMPAYFFLALAAMLACRWLYKRAAGRKESIKIPP
jgi:4-amino-4-deoxy-L-arabinose transferase-like glycosyltransferase